MIWGRTFGLFGESFGEGLLIHHEAFGYEEGIALFVGVDIGFDEFLDGQFLVVIGVGFPEFFGESDFVGGFEAAESEFEVEVIEFVAEEFGDPGSGVDLDEVFADEVEDIDEGSDVIIHGRMVENGRWVFELKAGERGYKDRGERWWRRFRRSGLPSGVWRWRNGDWSVVLLGWGEGYRGRWRNIRRGGVKI